MGRKVMSKRRSGNKRRSYKRRSGLTKRRSGLTKRRSYKRRRTQKSIRMKGGSFGKTARFGLGGIYDTNVPKKQHPTKFTITNRSRVGKGTQAKVKQADSAAEAQRHVTEPVRQPPDTANNHISSAVEAKNLGNQAFNSGEYADALQFYIMAQQERIVANDYEIHRIKNNDAKVTELNTVNEKLSIDLDKLRDIQRNYDNTYTFREDDKPFLVQLFVGLTVA